MKESAIVDLYDVYREQTIDLMGSITDEQSDVIPDGFSNSLRWNFGHILVAQEQSMYNLGLNQPGEIAMETMDSFKRGSSPKDWSVTPLTLEEIREKLQKQKERMKSTFSGRLGDPAAKVMDLGQSRELKTLGDLFVGSLWHEGLHQGVIDGIKRSLK
ncbi:DinB family protein [Scopulibacillus darangshiensis]|uniref:DinB family protein n=1 Tax=Scopulibacillus darangshiensis TaxID=442528 RepID=A0A4R2ND23_9BACL|nr:DinB family protein [Scopulibacillus darangshiensis]TCP19139.1 DinB family protein [Scopulibacillus darangshiensis]